MALHVLIHQTNTFRSATTIIGDCVDHFSIPVTVSTNWTASTMGNIQAIKYHNERVLICRTLWAKCKRSHHAEHDMWTFEGNSVSTRQQSASCSHDMLPSYPGDARRIFKHIDRGHICWWRQAGTCLLAFYIIRVNASVFKLILNCIHHSHWSVL